MKTTTTPSITDEFIATFFAAIDEKLNETSSWGRNQFRKLYLETLVHVAMNLVSSGYHGGSAIQKLLKRITVDLDTRLAAKTCWSGSDLIFLHREVMIDALADLLNSLEITITTTERSIG